MIVVRVELWPFGDKTRARHLGTAVIANDGTGDPQTGNYWVKLYGKGEKRRLWRETVVADFPRKRLLVWDLLYRALKNVVGERNT